MWSSTPGPAYPPPRAYLTLGRTLQRIFASKIFIHSCTSPPPRAYLTLGHTPQRQVKFSSILTVSFFYRGPKGVWTLEKKGAPALNALQAFRFILKKDPYRILVPKIGTHFVRVLFGWITIAMCFLSTLFTGVLLFLLVISYSSSM